MYKTKEFKCVVCGTKGVYEFRGGTPKRYCSERCKGIYTRIKNYGGCSTEINCKYNEGVACEIQECEKCGWNPVVEEQRKAALITKGCNEGR